MPVPWKWKFSGAAEFTLLVSLSWLLALRADEEADACCGVGCRRRRSEEEGFWERVVRREEGWRVRVGWWGPRAEGWVLEWRWRSKISGQGVGVEGFVKSSLRPWEVGWGVSGRRCGGVGKVRSVDVGGELR